MIGSVHVLKPRKPKRLKTASDKLSKRELTAKLMRISKAQAVAKKSAITYPPELLPVPDLGAEVYVIVSCNRPDCSGEGCRYCGIVKFQAKKGRIPT